MSTASIRTALLALLVTVWPIASSAHTHLDRSEPAEGATLETTPDQVHLWFAGRIEPRFSRIEVFGPDGEQVDQGDTEASADRRELTVGLTDDLPPGDYEVEWNVVARDGHRVRGQFTFTLK